MHQFFNGVMTYNRIFFISYCLLFYTSFEGKGHVWSMVTCQIWKQILTVMKTHVEIASNLNLQYIYELYTFTSHTD